MVTDNFLAAKEYEMYSISTILKSSVYLKKETQSITTIYLSIKKTRRRGSSVGLHWIRKDVVSSLYMKPFIKKLQVDRLKNLCMDRRTYITI